MVVMEHPNGCVHNVREDLVDRFKAAGWNVKAAPCEQPSASPAGEQKKRKPREKK